MKWNGGRGKSSHGYITINLRPDSPFLPMADKNHLIYEHRLIMAKHLGRCLNKNEVVHHKNGIRDDNKLGNLEITHSIGEHSVLHNQGYQDGFKKGYLDGQSKKIKEQELYIIELEDKLAGIKR